MVTPVDLLETVCPCCIIVLQVLQEVGIRWPVKVLLFTYKVFLIKKCEHYMQDLYLMIFGDANRVRVSNKFITLLSLKWKLG